MDEKLKRLMNELQLDVRQIEKVREAVVSVRDEDRMRVEEALRRFIFHTDACHSPPNLRCDCGLGAVVDAMWERKP